jgi:nucleoside-diphosphate-sugar epimerase
VDAPVTSSGGYAASKGAAEILARDLQAQGAPLHITYPAGLIGPAAGEALGETSTAMARFVAGGVLPTRLASLSLLDVRDLSEIHARLLAAGPQPARVMCGGAHLSMVELASLLREVTGRRFPIIPAAPRLLRATGRLLDRVGSVLQVELALTEESMTVITPGRARPTMPRRSWTFTTCRSPRR